MEEWKTIEGYSRYKVSNFGEVFDTKLDRLVAKQLTGEPQYYYVNMNRDDGERKLERLHRLVAKAFVEGWSEEFDVVDHIDRDKLNNRFNNLRWTDTRGNFRNLEKNLIVEDVFLKDYVLKYENPEAAYSYISSHQRNISIEDAVQKYEEYLEYGRLRDKVVYKGEEVYITDLVESVSIDYDTFRNRIRQGYEVWNALYGVLSSHFNSFEIKEKSVHYWYPHKTYWCEQNKRSDDVLRRGLERGWSTEEVVNSDGKEDLRQTILGITGTIIELCEHFKVSEGTVSTRMTRRGMTLEEALTAPRERVKSLAINDIYKSPKDWCIEFGIEPKLFSSTKSRKKFDFKEAFEFFGVGTEGMIFKDY